MSHLILQNTETMSGALEAYSIKHYLGKSNLTHTKWACDFTALLSAGYLQLVRGTFILQISLDNIGPTLNT